MENHLNGAIEWYSPGNILGEARRTVDLSPLNKHCLREVHAMRSPFELAKGVPEKTWRTVVDAWNSFHSVPLRNEDKHLTTFITPWGRFRYLRAPHNGSLQVEIATTDVSMKFSQILRDTRDVLMMF